ncbi:hypothetical protein P170DRAFT_389205 [Aspergillus steynii IBT 23096]|uniref:Uncharacterized protein n=1 Tax=Aspergillus steynii IBT 23096 TaxID=1392250 RepID=A0A2I2FXQ2_9EURO|nr:uncharacterized protein P170DRAFT_389205 [Aspergillus steynii IBT 23096]PLB45411.1 hypothetical protein P170DRAFT_389205 [Aspergillus steynii IBT 23096]
MKLSVAVASFLAASVSASFDKYQPWGKRDYSCVNIYQGIPDNSTVAPGAEIDLRFNRAPTTHCADPLSKYEAGTYSVWLYNNPVRNLDTISFDQSLKLKTGIRESDGAVTVTIPNNVTAVKDSSVWYLRVDTYLPNAPQMPTLFDAAGPFTIKA